jgi:hypothetical protein
VAGTVSEPSAVAPGSELTVNELVLAFWNHAQTHYRKLDGELTSEIHNFRVVIRDLRGLYGHTPRRFVLAGSLTASFAGR